MNGVNLVATPNEIQKESFLELTQINASWISIIPYAYSHGYTSKVYFNTNSQWWGETIIGVQKTIDLAQEQDLKTMLKPHIWFGWGKNATDFKLSTEQDWIAWEKSYSNYILAFAKIAATKKVDLFCFSTELKQVVLERPQFFKQLITKIRAIYKGNITYAANWDNYENVTFWNDVDFIGIDAYFPLSEEKQPSVATLHKKWTPIKEQLKKIAHKHNKPILFTEYGFESCDYNTKETWGSNGKHPANQQAQTNAYKAFFDSFYNENWFAGGFLWKWHLTEETKRNTATSYTPQNKQVLQLIQQKFQKR